MPKKQISNTYFDVIYIIGTSIITGLVRSIAEGLLKAVGFNLEAMSSGASVGVGLLIGLVSIWIGVMIISQYINRNFKLENKEKALRSALTFFVVFIAVGVVALLLIGIPIPYLIVVLIQALLAGAALYFFGKRYIKESEVQK